MNTSRESRIETIGGMKALIDMPSVSKVDQQMKTVILPKFIAVLEDCNELEKERDDFKWQRDELMAAAKYAKEVIGILWVSHQASRADAAIEQLIDAIGKAELA